MSETIIQDWPVLLNPVKPEAYLLAPLVISFSSFPTLTFLRLGLS